MYRDICAAKKMMCGGCSGPGYATPADAIKGPRERYLFTTAPHTDASKPDALFTVDVDPDSDTYCQLVSKVELAAGDEVHHSGWNACSSCHSDGNAKRSHLILPCLNSDRVYVINVEKPTDIKQEKVIEPSSLHSLGVSFPHTSHCLADGDIMISTLGDAEGNNKGDFLLLDGSTFEPKKTWGVPIPFHYDFWYQPRRNTMISTEWGAPRLIKDGFDPTHVGQGHYGHSVHVFNWKEKTLRQSIELPMPSGALPLEVRFPHEPTRPDAYVGTALGSSIYHIRPDNEENPASLYVADCLVTIPAKKVSGWALPEMPALITDILVSMDDRFLYISCWLHGDLRQYDISDPAAPKLTGQVFIGGSLHTQSGVTLEDEGESAPSPLVVKGRRIEGGPQMLQMSLDGKRLYVTTSLYRKWDQQFYPKLSGGACMLQLDIGENGGMSINENFLVDFSKAEGGPYLAHEMRYPGGDCTSDIWI